MERDFSKEVTIADVGEVQWHPVFVVSREVPNMLRMLSAGINTGLTLVTNGSRHSRANALIGNVALLK